MEQLSSQELNELENKLAQEKLVSLMNEHEIRFEKLCFTKDEKEAQITKILAYKKILERRR